MLNATINYRKCAYVQGMNVLTAMFISAMNEPEAFWAMQEFMDRAPSYFAPHISGVLKGCELVQKVLRCVDPEIADALEKQKMSSKIYAFQDVMSFQARRPPIEAALRLWDVLLAGGLGMNIIITVSEIINIRDELLSDKKANDVFLEHKDCQNIDKLIEILRNIIA